MYLTFHLHNYSSRNAITKDSTSVGTLQKLKHRKIKEITNNMQIHHLPKQRQNLQLQAGLRSANAVWWLLVSGNLKDIHSTFNNVARVRVFFQDQSVFAAQWYLLLNPKGPLHVSAARHLILKLEVLCCVSRSTSILYTHSFYTIKDILNTFRKGTPARMLLLHWTIGALDYNRQFPVH